MNNNYLRSLRIVHFTLALGIVFFVLITFFVNNFSGPFSGNDLTSSQRAPFLITLIVLTGAVFVIYQTFISKKLEAIKTLPSLERKLAAWREFCVLRGALIEAPAFFAIVLFMLLGVFTLYVWPLTAIVLFWLSQPTRERLISETSLSSIEIAEFDAMN